MTLPDPRPVLDGEGVVGQACATCGLSTTTRAARCPSCGALLAEARFAARGTVWSSTVVRVAVPGRTAPYALAYVDLDDGPRVLCHVDADARLNVHTRVAIVGLTALGDLLAEPLP